MNVPCPSRSCVPGCRCPAGTVWNSQRTKCIQLWKCPPQVRELDHLFILFLLILTNQGARLTIFTGLVYTNDFIVFEIIEDSYFGYSFV